MKKVLLGLCIYFMLALYFQVEGQNRYELMYLQNHFDTIVDKAQNIIHSRNPDSNDYYWYAMALHKKGEVTRCIKILEEGLQHSPDDKELDKLLANVYFEAGNYTEAIPILGKFPEDKECRMKLARIHEFNNNYSEAIRIFQRLYEQDTSNVLYLRHLGDNYYKLDSLSKALSYYEKALSVNPYDQPTVYKLSRIYLKRQEYQRSIEVCEPILAKDSTNVRFLKQTGYVYFEWKKYAQASEYLSRSLVLGDSSVFIYKYLGISEIGNHAFHSGREHLLEAYKKDTSDFEICFFLGRAFLNSPTPGKGLYYLNKSDSLQQPDPSVLSAIYFEKQSIYGTLGKYKKAVECYQSAYKYNQKPEYLFYIASIYQNKIGDKSKALEFYRLFINELPPKPDSEHEISKKQIVVSLRKAAENNIAQLKEELFFEGRLNN